MLQWLFPQLEEHPFLLVLSLGLSFYPLREFFRVLIAAEKNDLDVGLAEQDILEAGRALVAANPEVGAIVLECTNMPPYAAALAEAVGLPVYDIYSMIAYFHAGLRPRRFA